MPPAYFTLDDGRHSLGGGWGFLTEGGPGENPMSVNSLKVQPTTVLLATTVAAAAVVVFASHQLHAARCRRRRPVATAARRVLGALRQRHGPLRVTQTLQRAVDREVLVCTEKSALFMFSFSVLGTGNPCRYPTTLVRPPRRL